LHRVSLFFYLELCSLSRGGWESGNGDRLGIVSCPSPNQILITSFVLDSECDSRLQPLSACLAVLSITHLSRWISETNKMFWFHFLSTISVTHLISSSLFSTYDIVNITQVHWHSSQYLESYLISSSSARYSCRQESRDEDENDSVDCYDRDKKLISFDLRNEMMTFHPMPNSYLCMSQFHNGIFTITNSPNLHPNLCEIKIPLRKKMIIDAFLFLDWTKVSFFLNEITDDLICRGLDSFTQKNQHDINFFPISISEQYGNPFGLLYWLDRCGYSTGKDSSLPNFAMIQLWQIDDLMLKRASTSSISPESCPCIVRKILLLKNTSTTLSDSSLRGNCLEEILLNLATSHEGSLSLLSTLGFRNLIAFKEEKVQTQSLLHSQEAKQMIFSLQAFQSASATATATDSSFVPPQNMKFQVTSIMRPILTATSEQRFAIKEFIHFKNKLQNIFFSSNSTTSTTTATTWMTTGNYARLISYVNDFSVYYIRNSRNHFETSRLLHWLSELLLPCTTGYRSGIFVVDHCCPSSCLLLFSSPATGNNNTTNTSLMKFLDLVHILITNAPNSSNLSILRSVIYELRQESLLPQDFIPLESPSTRTATTASVMQSMYQTIILIFVTPEDVLEAELFVASWRSSIPTPKHLYSYHIIPTEDCLLLLCSHKTHVSSSRRPCLRSVLLNLEQWMNEFTSNQDRVVVLIGIESLSTLVYSSSNSSSNKIFLAESHHLSMENSTLFSLIFAAAAPSSLQNPPSANSEMKLGDILDFRAFTGFAQAIKQMILEIRLSPYYTLTAENGILFAFFHFCLNSIQNQQHSQESTAAAGAEAGAASDRHSLLLFVDTEREYFDTTNTRSGNALPFLHSFPTKDPYLENVHQQMTILRDQILDTGFASNQLIWVPLSSLPCLFIHLLLGSFLPR
jgi:hypothetical protein